MLNYLDMQASQDLIEEIKIRFVQKATGKVLSENDFTNLLKQKLDGIESSADANKIEGIKRNGINVEIGVDKIVDMLVPTKTSDLTNDSEFQTEAQVQALLSQVDKFKIEVVAALPSIATADTRTMYLVPNQEGTGHVEWLAINSKWEMIGDTGTIDLSDYVKTTDLVPIAKAEILAMFNA